MADQTIQVQIPFYWWSVKGMVRDGPAGFPVYLLKSEVEAFLGEVHRQAFAAGFAKGVAESASVVRTTPIRPG
jgi:hypothetical protein